MSRLVEEVYLLFRSLYLCELTCVEDEQACWNQVTATVQLTNSNSNILLDNQWEQVDKQACWNQVSQSWSSK